MLPRPFLHLAAVALLSTGCTIDRTLDLGREAGARSGLLPAWRVARSGTWRLPGDAAVLVVADDRCVGDTCRRAAALGRPAALNAAVRDLLTELMAGPFPRVEAHGEALGYEAALASATRQRKRFLLHVHVAGLEPGSPLRRARGALYLVLVDTRDGHVVDRARVEARADLFGRTDSSRALIRAPLAEYVGRLARTRKGV